MTAAGGEEGSAAVTGRVDCCTAVRKYEKKNFDDVGLSQ